METQHNIIIINVSKYLNISLVFLLTSSHLYLFVLQKKKKKTGWDHYFKFKKKNLDQTKQTHTTQNKTAPEAKHQLYRNK